MTNEEAMLWLVSLAEHEGEEVRICDEDAKALQIGIDAIKALETHEGDLIPREAVINILKNEPSYWGGHLECVIHRDEVIADIKHLPSSTPQPKLETHGSTYGGVSWGGTYMRDATKQEQKSTSDYIKSISKPTGVQFNDLISREAVIDHICEDKECYKEECKGRTLKRCPDLQWVFDLPSATPQPKVGRWIEVDPLGTGDKTYQCSECKTGDWSITVEEYQYCPYCGCYMENGGKDYVFPQ